MGRPAGFSPGTAERCTMKRLFLGIAALALLLVATESASARPWYGVSAGYGWGGPYVGASYGTRVGNNGFLSVGVAAPVGGYGGGGDSFPAGGGRYAPPPPTTPPYDYPHSPPAGESTHPGPRPHTSPPPPHTPPHPTQPPHR